MKVYSDTLLDWQIRQLHNSFRDGTATDAINRHTCRVALGELCIGDDMPGGLRYPTREEIAAAKVRLARIWNERHGDEP